jgi:hypothetical protein
MLQVDDDLVCRIAPSPDDKQQLTLTSKYSPHETHFLSESETQSLENRFSSGNIFQLHERILGRSLYSCLKAETKIDFDATNSSFFTRSSADSIVAVSALGYGGDAGTGTSYHFLGETAETHADLVRSEAVYRYAMSRQQVLRFVKTPVISDGSFCCSGNLGMDNRQTLPPFAPVQRNEDGTFGCLFNSATNHFFGFLPWLALHNRPPRFCSPDDLRTDAARVSCGDILPLLLEKCVPKIKHVDPGTNLKIIGETLAHWGTAPRAEFEERLRLALLERAANRIRMFEQLLSLYKMQPGFYIADVKMCITALQESVIDKRYIIPQDLIPTFGEELARTKLQELVRNLGQLLTIWTDLRTAAGELLKGGWQPFTRV